MLKQKIKISTVGDDAIVNIGFKSVYNLGGLSQDIENLVSYETDSSVNSVVDEEKRRFSPNKNYTIGMEFYSTGTTNYVTNVAPNEFTTGDTLSSQFTNSFYVYKVYDSPFQNTQNLLHTGYINGFSFAGNNVSIYPWTGSSEYTDIHLPISFLDSITATTFNLYMKMNFYSAKSGKVYPFSGITTTNTENDLYNKLTFTGSTKKYSTPPLSNFTFKEITNPEYVALVNDSISSISLEKPTYPSGNTFTTDGVYLVN